MADADGVVVVEREKLASLIPAAHKKVEDEAKRIAQIKEGKTAASWLVPSLRAAGVLKDGEEIGKVTSGSVLPTVGGAGGMALLHPRKAKVGDLVEVDVRGKRKLARLVQKPLYKAKVKG